MQKGAIVRLPLRFALLFGSLLILTALFAGDQFPSNSTTLAGPSGPGCAAAGPPPTSCSHFRQNSVYRFCNTTFPSAGIPTMCAEGPGSETLTPGAAYDTTVSFNLPWGHMNFSQVVALGPPDSVLTPSSGVGGLPLGAIVARLRSSTTLGLANAPCTPLGSETGTLEINFTFFNATTQTNLVLEPFPLTNASGEGTAEVYRDDIDGNGLPDHVDKYPSYLNKVFDPDRNGDINGDGDELDSIAEATAEATLGLDLNADGDTADAADLNNDGDAVDTIAENPGATAADPFGTVEPLVPLARYSANTNVVGTAIALEFLTFEPGQLQAFASPHPFSDVGPELGYPTVVVLTDPTQPLSPSTITDFCTPLATFTVTWGVTRDNPCTPAAGPSGTVELNDGTGCFNSNSMCATACGNNNFINEGNPAAPVFGSAGMTVCVNEADDDGDGAANDGCPAVGLPEATCNDNGGVGGADADNDGDFFVDDGCPVVGVAGELTSQAGYTIVDGLRTNDPDGCDADANEGGCTRASLPPTDVGVHGEGTNMIISYAASLRDVDADGYENNFDTCKEDVNVDGDPRVNNSGGAPPDADMIDSACDPHPTFNNGGGNQDGDSSGFPPNGWANGQDNCPVYPNDTQRQLDNNLPRSRITPFGGPAGDDIGDACEGAETGADCASGNAVDDDADTLVNDGCPPRGGGNGTGDAESGAACLNAVQDDLGNDSTDPNGAAPDDFINDGCPTRATAVRFLQANGHFHSHFEVQPKCISTTDTDVDRDGYCDDLEAALGPASIVSNAGNPGNQTGCESPFCGQDGAGLTGPGGREMGAQCTNATDDDGDGFANDGCPQVGGTKEEDVAGDAQCDDATDDDLDGVVNDGCFLVGRGNCSDGVDNDGDGFTDSADAGCLSPEDHVFDYPAPLLNLGSGADADNDGIPDHDDAEGTPNDDAANTADGQEEEPHTVCNDDTDQDGDGTRDAFAQLNNGGADGMAAEASCSSHVADDADRDSLSNANDNCDAAHNPSQRDTNGDGEGDACDTDDDGDGTSDAAERACGSRTHNASSVCEIAGNGLDDDKDGATDEAQVPSTVNPTVRAAAGPTGDRWKFHDRDGDGWTLEQERFIGTEPNVTVGNPLDDDPCGNNGWPSELAGANNTLNIGDVNSFTAPTRPAGDEGAFPSTFNTFNHQLDDDGDGNIETNEDPGAPGGNTYNVARWNIQALSPPVHLPTTRIDNGDQGALYNGAVGSPARPPMFGGQQAYFTSGGKCPFPP